MKIVEVGEGQKEFWNEFIAENNPECFLQSWQWGEFQKDAGKKVWRLGILEEASGGRLTAAAQIIESDLPFGANYLYCPRGPVFGKFEVKEERLEVFDALIGEIKKIAGKGRSLFLRIDPPWETNLASGVAYRENPRYFRKSPNEIQPKDTLILDLTKTEEQLLSEMKQKTRYNIRLAEKRGVEILVASEPEKYLPEFWELIEETSRRNEISSHDEKYYRKMLKALRGSNSGKDDSKTVPVLNSRLYLARYENRIIAANIALFFGKLAVYLHGASSDRYRNVMAPYLLQWKQIKHARETGCRTYDFWGITVNDEKETWRGITRFKMGFGGKEKRYIGAFDLPFDKVKYDLYIGAKKAAGFLRKMKR